MVMKLVALAVFFVALCFAGVGCFRDGSYVLVGDSIYYDGPYRSGNNLYYYYDGGLYVYKGGDYHLERYVPQDLRGYYSKESHEERSHKHHEQYHRDYPKSKWNQHPGHSGQPPRMEEWRE